MTFRPGSLFARWSYYLGSIPTLLLGIRNRAVVLAAFARPRIRRPLTIELRSGSRFKVRDALDIWVVKETCLDRQYERDAVAVQNGWTVVDIGAGLGDFAVSVALRCPESSIFAFEPVPESFALLNENVALNRLGNVRTSPEAVSAKAGPILLDTTLASGQHRIADRRMQPRGGPIGASAVTLDQALARLGTEEIHFLKVDCEGAEYEILFAASPSTLQRIRHMVIEYHDAVSPYSHGDLVRFLVQHGFRVRTRANPAHRLIGFLFATRLQAA